jgi:hypothetical protein
MLDNGLRPDAYFPIPKLDFTVYTYFTSSAEFVILRYAVQAIPIVDTNGYVYQSVSKQTRY